MSEALRQLDHPEAAKLSPLKAGLENLEKLMEGELASAIQNAVQLVAAKKYRNRTGGQRLIPRYNRRLAVRYSLAGPNNKVTRGFTHDIGAMGLFIMANRPEQEGAHLNLELTMPELGTVKMQGVVVWTKWVAPALRGMDYMGFGIKITTAPEAWFNYFMKQK